MTLLGVLSALQAELIEKQAELVQLESRRSPIQPRAVLSQTQIQSPARPYSPRLKVTAQTQSWPEFEITRAAREQRKEASRHAELHERNSQVEAQLRESQLEKAQLCQQLEMQQQNERNISHELDELRTRCSLMQTGEFSALRNEAQLLEQEQALTERLHSENTQLQSENTQLQREIVQLQSENARLKHVTQQQKSAQHQDVTRTNHADLDRARLEAENSQLRQAESLGSAQLDQLQYDLEQLQSQAGGTTHSTAVRLEQLEQDNMRLSEIIFALPDFADFAHIAAEHTGGLAYVGGHPELERKFLAGRYMHNAHSCPKVSPSKEHKSWVPRTVYDAAEDFRRRHMSSIDPELIKHLVWRLARLLIRNAQLGAKLPHDRLTAAVSDLKRQLKQRESKRVKQSSVTKAKHKPLRGVEQTRPSNNARKIEQERVLTSAIKHLSDEVTRLIEASDCANCSLIPPTIAHDEIWRQLGCGAVHKVDELGELVLKYTTQLRHQTQDALIDVPLSSASNAVLSHQNRFCQLLDDSVLQCRCEVATLFGV